MVKRNITEKDNLQDEWYDRARKIETPEELTAFMLELLGENGKYAHDYGTVVHAVAASSIAAAWVANRMPQGGMTGFQAGCVFWEFAKHWHGVKGAARLMQYEDMLYPQYGDRFDNMIDASTWTDLQSKAKKMLDESPTSAPQVREHWQSIINGVVPFGYTVRKEN